MSLTPMLRLKKAQYGMKTSSQDYNQNIDDILFNLHNLFEEINYQTDLIKTIEETLRIENQYQMIKIQKLQEELESIKSIYQSIDEQENQYIEYIYAKDMYTNDSILPHEKATINKSYNITTLPVLGEVESKVYLYNEIEGKIIVPDDLKLKIRPEPLYQDIAIQDNDIRNAFNGNNNSVWRRKYLYPINTEQNLIETTTVLEVTLPENIISNRNVNMIQINPFPISSITIEKIEYYLNGVKSLLPGWPTMRNAQNQIIPQPIRDKGIQAFYFSPIDMDSIEITISQDKYMVENNKKVYHLGAQEIGIFNIDYKSNVGRFIGEATLNGTTQIKVIEEIIPHFKNEILLSDKTQSKSTLFTFDIYQKNQDNQLEYTSDQFPVQLSGNKIIIKGNLFYDDRNNVAPALSHIEVKYRDFV